MNDQNVDFTQLALLYSFCPECRDKLMFWCGDYMKDKEGQSVCVECLMDNKE